MLRTGTGTPYTSGTLWLAKHGTDTDGLRISILGDNWHSVRDNILKNS
jgi:hypothetical protein